MSTQPTPQPQATHLPVAPYVPELHSQQRYYSRGTGSGGYLVQGGPTHEDRCALAEITVMRFADDDFARVENCLSIGDHNSRTQLVCTAQELRDIALRLLDAAHDLETNPAAKLMLAEGGGA